MTPASPFPEQPPENSPEPRPRTELRASDADREAVAERLREAAGDGRIDLDELAERLDRTFAAKTYGELEPVLSDLPGEDGARPAGPPSRPVQQQPEQPLVVRGGWGGMEQVGHWTAPGQIIAHGGVGSVTLDFTAADLRWRETDVLVHGDVGGIKIIVPEGWAVDVAAVDPGLGGVKNKVTLAPDPGAPLLRVTGSAGIGGLVVRYRNRWEKRKLRHKQP
ncbi:DUF1707 domain-containing protein [Streptomyces sp. ACA25]|uniref:DUF1707 SHOCT-like domain-containing protein n=1 Tax=Streptomyces sp. ACA25 TaxID=3022596 RepID=UPI00230712DC|nr:DUF1707 domain-containing protein [Streptomyces sp. ACA25]MDB1087383.1 DUF1707 domain-containing protein [Streptomyces sp. ACA25]